MKQTTKEHGIQMVFISSTHDDMEEYRNAASDALTSIEHFPVGMEHFVAATDTPLDVCLANVRRCQLMILLVGMRYGSVDKNTGKSYTELEYEEALRNNIPVLSFIIDESKCPVLPMYVDTDEKAAQLKLFKKRLKEKQVSFFISAENLKGQIVQAVTKYFEEKAHMSESKANEAPDDEAYIVGAKIYRKFLLVPERLKNSEIFLRVRMDGLFANSFLRRKELFDAYGLLKGDTVIAENVIPIGVDFDDINDEAAYVDLYAEGKNADWLIDNGVTTGVIFEGKFRLAYEFVEKVAKDEAHDDYISSQIPALILVEGLAVVGKSEESRYSVRHKGSHSRSASLDFLNDLLNK